MSIWVENRITYNLQDMLALQDACEPDWTVDCGLWTHLFLAARIAPAVGQLSVLTANWISSEAKTAA